MGQKVHPKGLRIGIIRDWDSRWYSGKKDFPKTLLEDQKVRKFIKKTLYASGIARVEIERDPNRIRVFIHTAKPGMVIGKGGTGVENLRKTLEAMTGKHVSININEIKAPELEAQLVAESVASSLEKRVGFRRAMKQAISRTLRLGARGAKVIVSGRLGGAEMARREASMEGSVPLHTLRADVDYGFAVAKTTYGQIGVKVWVYKGEVIPEKKAASDPGKPGKRVAAGPGIPQKVAGERRG
ncbi:MAG: 30S ribosomal protein S3 [Firmicutes bacterium]|nr:30S ribosomal protein S3 [Bacillota bacterium]